MANAVTSDNLVGNEARGASMDLDTARDKAGVPTQEAYHEEFKTTNDLGDLVYDDNQHEPELNFRTYCALAAMIIYNFTACWALQGPPTVLSYIGKSLNGTSSQLWIVNAPAMVQVVLGPVQSFASDYFQARKFIIVVDTGIAFIGAIAVATSNDIAVLIGSSILIGMGWAATPMAYSVVAEILPKRWRPISQSLLNIAATLGFTMAPLSIGALTRADEKNGWRKFYWIETAFWGAACLLTVIAYRPPKRHTRHDHLSLWQKLGQLDIPGTIFLTVWLVLFLTGMNLGGNQYAWTNVRVLAPMGVGLVSMIVFFIWEWKGTKTGILHHQLFYAEGGARAGFLIYVGLMFAEGVLVYSVIVFYPIMSEAIFTTDPFTIAIRGLPYWACACIGTAVFGWSSSLFRSIRWPLLCGMVFFTVGTGALVAVNPGKGAAQLVSSGIAGFGFGAPLILIVAGVQLIVPHHLIGTASALLTSARNVAGTIFTAIFSKAFSERFAINAPREVTAAAVKSGVPSASIPVFVTAVIAGEQEALAKMQGVTDLAIAQAFAALKQSYADSLRCVYYIAFPFGVVAVVGCFFLGSLKKLMNYHVDAPVEELHAKRNGKTISV